MSQAIESLKELLPDFARDIKINLGNCLAGEGSPGLQPNQIAGVALASAYAAKNQVVTGKLLEYAREVLSPEEIEGAKAAATVMAMNNIYYRFLHLVSDKDYQVMPAKLRMMVIGNPGIPKVDFEMDSLAVSAINGCGMCLDAHAAQLVKAGVSKEAVQSVVRISAVVNAAAQAVSIMALQ